MKKSQNSKMNKIGRLADIYRAENLDGAIFKIELKKIQSTDYQPRQDGKIEIEELAQSLKQEGLLSPIIVKKEARFYKIIAGERRYHAAKRLDWESIECKVLSRSEADYWRIAIIENLQRENLSAQEEAHALSRLKQQENLTDEKLAKLVGKSRNYISEILSIAKLSSEALERCKSIGLTRQSLLVQVGQAYKKNKGEAFLSAYQKGKIITVQQAKKFNQTKQDNPKKTLQNPKSENLSQLPIINERKTQVPTFFHCRQNNEHIYIRCPNNTAAVELLQKIKTLLPKL